MLSNKKIEAIINLGKEEYPSLYNELIMIEEDDEFSMMSSLGMYCIYYTKKIKDARHNKFMYKYLKKEYNLDADILMYNDFLEIFALLHELGHIYYIDTDESINSEELYQEYKEKTYKTYEEAYREYRQLPNEKLADEFAVNIIKRNFLDIWSISNEISKEKAKNEYKIWLSWAN